MTGDRKSSPPKRKKGRPRGARNKRTIARLTAMERIAVHSNGREIKTATYAAILSVLQRRALARNNVDAARLWNQIANALHPEVDDLPRLFIMVPEIAAPEEWERMAAPRPPGERPPLLQRLRYSRGKSANR